MPVGEKSRNEVLRREEVSIKLNEDLIDRVNEVADNINKPVSRLVDRALLDLIIKYRSGQCV